MESGFNDDRTDSQQANRIVANQEKQNHSNNNKATVNNTGHKLKIHPIIAKTIESCRISAATSTQSNNNNNTQQTPIAPNESKPKKASHQANPLRAKELIFEATANLEQKGRDANLLANLKATNRSSSSSNNAETKVAKKSPDSNNNNNSNNPNISKQPQETHKSPLEARRLIRPPLKQDESADSTALILQRQTNDTVATSTDKQQHQQTIAKQKIINPNCQKVNSRARKPIKQIAGNKINNNNRIDETSQQLKGDHYVYACNGLLDLTSTQPHNAKHSHSAADQANANKSRLEDSVATPARNPDTPTSSPEQAGLVSCNVRAQAPRKATRQRSSLGANGKLDDEPHKSTFNNPMRAIEAKYFDLEEQEGQQEEQEEEDDDEHQVGENPKVRKSLSKQQQQTLHLRPNIIKNNCDCVINNNNKNHQFHQAQTHQQHKASCLAFGRPIKTKKLTKLSSSNKLIDSNHDQNWLLIQQQQQQLNKKNQIILQAPNAMFEHHQHHHHHASQQQQFGQPGFYYASGTASGSSLSEQTSSSSPPPQQQRNIVQHQQHLLTHNPLNPHCQSATNNQMSILMSNYSNHHHHHQLSGQDIRSQHHLHHHLGSSSSSLISRLGTRMRHYFSCLCCCCLPSSATCHSKCFTNTLMVITILIFIIVSSFSIYLTLPMSPTSLKSQFAALSGRLKIESRGDNFAESLLNRTSPLFQLKQVQYETILRGALDQTSPQLRSFSNHLVQCEVYSFRPGSLWVHFRLYLNKESLMGDSMLRRRKAPDEQLESHFLPRLTQQTIQSGFEQLIASNGSTNNSNTSANGSNTETRSVRSHHQHHNQHHLITAASHHASRHQNAPPANPINSTAELHSLKSFDDQIMRLMPIIENVDLQSILVTPEFDMLAIGNLAAMSDNLRSSGQFQQQHQQSKLANQQQPQAEIAPEVASSDKPISTQKPTTTATVANSVKLQQSTTMTTAPVDGANKSSVDSNIFTLFNYKHTATRPGAKPVVNPTATQNHDNLKPISTPELDDLDPFLRNQALAKQPNYNVIGPIGNSLVPPPPPPPSAKPTTESRQVVKLSSGQPVTTSQHKAENSNLIRVQTSAPLNQRNNSSQQVNTHKNQKLINSSTSSTTTTTTSTSTSTTTTKRPLILDSSASIQDLWNNALNSSLNRTAIRQQHQEQSFHNSRRPNQANADKAAEQTTIIGSNSSANVTTAATTTTSTSTSTNRPPKVSPLQNQGGSMIIGMNAKLQQQKQQKLQQQQQSNSQQSAVILNSENNNNSSQPNLQSATTQSRQNQSRNNFANTFKSNKPQSLNSAANQQNKPINANGNTSNNKLAKLASFVQQQQQHPNKQQNGTAPSDLQGQQPAAIDLSRTVTRVQLISSKTTAKPAASSTSTTTTSADPQVVPMKPAIVVFVDTTSTSTTTTTTTTPSILHQPNLAPATTTTSNFQPTTTTTMENLYASLMNQNAQTTRPGTSIFSSQWKPINMTALVGDQSDVSLRPKLIQIGSGQSSEQVLMSNLAALQGSQSPFAMPMPSMVSASHEQASSNATTPIASLSSQPDLKPIRSHRQNSTQNRKPNQRIMNTQTLLPQSGNTNSRSSLTSSNAGEHFGFESHRVSGVRTLYRNNANNKNNNRFVDDFSISTPGGPSVTTESLGAPASEPVTTQAPSIDTQAELNLPRTLDAFSFQTLSLENSSSPLSLRQGDSSGEMMATTPLSMLLESGQLPNLHPHHKRLLVERKQQHKQLNQQHHRNHKKLARAEDERFGLLINNEQDALTTQPSVIVTTTHKLDPNVHLELDSNSNNNDAGDFLLVDQNFENRRGSSTRSEPVLVVVPSDQVNSENNNNNSLTALAQCRFHGCKAKDTLEYICLNNNQICDEFIDCQDESDEHDCVSLLKYDNFQPNRLSFSNGAGIIYLNRRGSLAPMCIDYVDEQELVQAARSRGSQESELKQVRKETTRKQDELIRQINTMGQYACSLQSFSKLISFKVNNHQSVDDMNLIRSSKVYHRLTIVSNLDSNINNKRLDQTPFDAYKSGSPELKVLMSTSSECPSQRTVFVKCGSFECGLDSFSVRDNKNPEKIREGVINDSPWLVKLYHLGAQACHGYLIDEMWLISSSECFANYPESLAADWTAEISYEHYGNDYYRSIESNRRSIRNIFFHRDPLNSDASGDIVLAKFERPVRFSPLNRPICLPLESVAMTNKSSPMDPINRADLYQDCFTATLPFHRPQQRQPNQLQQQKQEQHLLAKQDLLLSKVKFNKLSDCLGHTTTVESQDQKHNLLCLTELPNRSTRWNQQQQQDNVTQQFELNATRVLICSNKQVSRSGSKWTVVAFQKSRLSQQLGDGKQLYSTIASQMDWIIDTMNPRTGQSTDALSMGTNSPFELAQEEPFSRLTPANSNGLPNSQQNNLPQTMSSSNNMDFEHMSSSTSNQGSNRQICNQYKCSTGECLSWAKTCDGSYDCPNHDDEKYCHR